MTEKTDQHRVVESMLDNDNTQSNANNSPTNPSCSSFDPHAALYSPLHSSLPAAEPLRNLVEFESYLGDPEAFRMEEVAKKRSRELKEQMKVAATSMGLSQPSQKYQINVLTRMPKFFGPKAQLNLWVESRVRLKVVIRSHVSIRGILTGQVVAFDHFLNLAMVDVDETYTRVRSSNHRRRPNDLDPDEPDALVGRLSRHGLTSSHAVHQRHISQLFVRGDNVVSIYPLR